MFEKHKRAGPQIAGQPFSHGTFCCVATALACRLAGNDVACEQDFRFPIFGSRDIFYNNATAASAVYAHDAFRRVFHNHGHVLNATAATEENKIARQYLFQRNTVALTGLCSGARGNFQVKFFEYVTRETGAIESGFWCDAGVAVTEPQEILGVSGDVTAQLHRFNVFGTVSWSAAYALERGASDKNEQKNG